MGGARRFVVAAWVAGVLGVGLVAGSLGSLHAGYRLSSVAGASMEPTYTLGDRVVFERVDGSEVGRGDVVLYSAPERYYGRDVMQRVVGVGGDHIVCCTHAGTPEERITVNGRPLDEPYLMGGVADGMHQPYDVTVPEGRLFLLGDHRENSRDSRAFPDDHGGTVPVGAVLGRATDDWTVPVLLAVGTLLGLVLVLLALCFAMTARVVRRRPAALLTLWPAHF